LEFILVAFFRGLKYKEIMNMRSIKSNGHQTTDEKSFSDFLSFLLLIALIFLTFISPGCSGGKEKEAKSVSSPEDKFQLYRVNLPSDMRPLPEPLDQDRSQPGFKIRA